MIYTLEQLEAIQHYLYKRGANDEKINDLIRNYGSDINSGLPVPRNK
jgi:hypothetical protein